MLFVRKMCKCPDVTNGKWPFKVIQGHVFLESVEIRQWDYVSPNNDVGRISEGSEDTATESTENCYFRLPHCPLTSRLQRTVTNIRINLMLPETRVVGLHQSL